MLYLVKIKNTPYEETENIEIKTVVKLYQTHYLPCITANVNEIDEKLICKNSNIVIRIPLFIDGIAAVGDADTIREGIRNFRKMETEGKI